MKTVPQLGVELGSQLLMLIVQGSDTVDENPIVPCVLPSFVVNLVTPAFTRFFDRLNIHDFGLVEHVMVKAEDFLILAELRRGLTRGRHVYVAGWRER